MEILTDIAKIDRTCWSNFVYNHPQGNVFQTPEMADVLMHTSNVHPVCVAIQEHDEIVGIVLGQVITSENPIMTLLSTRFIISGGPLVKDNDTNVLKLLLQALHKLLPWYIIYSEIRPVYAMTSIEECLLRNNWKRLGHYNLILPLDKTPEELFEQMHKERRRNVNQAIKFGLTYKEVTDKKEVDGVVELIRKTYVRKHVPMPYLDIFDEVYELMRQYTHFFAAYAQDGTMVAGQVRLCYRDLVYAWYAGSDDAYFKQRPNDFLMWEAIVWAHEHGYQYFDFGGGGEPGVEYGVRDYKLKYGCQMYEYGRYLYMYRPLTYHIGAWVYKTYHKILGK